MTYTVQLQQAEPQLIAAATERTTLARVSSDYGRILGAVWALLRARPELRRDGHNVAIYHPQGHPQGHRQVHPLTADVSVELGVQIVQRFDATASVVCSTTPAGTVAMTTHLGPYAQLGAAHEAVLSWCARSARSITGVRWEIYGDWDDDPAKLRTDVYWQLA
jgi:hypothetical protein